MGIVYKDGRSKRGFYKTLYSGHGWLSKTIAGYNSCGFETSSFDIRINSRSLVERLFLGIHWRCHCVIDTCLLIQSFHFAK